MILGILSCTRAKNIFIFPVALAMDRTKMQAALVMHPSRLHARTAAVDAAAAGASKIETGNVLAPPHIPPLPRTSADVRGPDVAVPSSLRFVI